MHVRTDDWGERGERAATLSTDPKGCVRHVWETVTVQWLRYGLKSRWKH